MRLLFLDIDGVLNTFQGELYHALHNQHANQRYECRRQEGIDKFDHDNRPHDFHQFLSLDWSVEATANLTWLLRAVPDLKIVVSSVWRYGHSQDSMRWLFVHYPEIFDRVIGRTVTRQDGIRGLEIQEYLDKNPVSDLVIIDDDADMEHLLPKLVQTNSYYGLTFPDIEKAMEILNVDRKQFSDQWFKHLREK